jgi:hypothetical protein
MGDKKEERSMLEDVQPRSRADFSARDEEHSILADLNDMGDHIQTLEEAARAARSVEFDLLRSVVRQLELVAAAAQAVERDLTQELSDTSRVSVATARMVRERLAIALRALSDALAVPSETADRV